MSTLRALSVAAPVVVLLASWSCSSATSPTSGSGATTSGAAATFTSLGVTGATGLSKVGGNLKLTATATFSDRTTEDVTASASWQSSSADIATVSGGLVTALANGSATIAATYLGKTATATVPIALMSDGTMTATIDRVAFSAVTVRVTNTTFGSPGHSTSQLDIVGGSGVSIPPQFVELRGPAAVGTYALGPLGPDDGYPVGLVQVLSGPTVGQEWSTVGASGSVTVSTLTSNSASGVFSMTVLGDWNGAAGTKSITNGVFNITF